MSRSLQIRVGFARYTLAAASQPRAGEEASASSALAPIAAQTTLREWAARSPDALRGLHAFYGGPPVGGSQLGHDHPLLQRLWADLRAGRVALIAPACSDHKGRGFAVARNAGALPLRPPPVSLGPSTVPAQAPASTPTAPPEPEPTLPEPELPDLNVAAQVETLRQAAEAGTPFCEECMRAAAARVA